MAAISLGLEWNPVTGEKRRRIAYEQNRHVTIFGPTRSGKGVAWEIVNLLRLLGISIISIDPKGQNCAVTMRWRGMVSKVVILDPLNMSGQGSAGFNPLAALLRAYRSKSPRYFEDASAIAEALIGIQGKDPFFDTMARGLVLMLILWEVKTADEEDRAPLLKNVRGMLSGDLPGTALKIFHSGDFQMAALAGQFVETSRTNDAIIASARAQMQWLLSTPILDDLAKDGIDFAILKKEAVTVYVIPPADALETYSVWLRLVVNSAMNALYRQGGDGLRTLFMLSEFAALGKLDMVATALGQGAGFGIQLACVLQDLNQLQEIYGEKSANTFLGMSGVTIAFTPNDPVTAEWMSARASDVTVVSPSTSDDQQTGLPRDSYRAERRRAISPGDMYEIPEFHGLVYFAGQSSAVPVFLPPYWDAKHNPDLQGRYDPDPYHKGTPTEKKSRGKGKLAIMAVAGLLAALALLRSDTVGNHSHMQLAALPPPVAAPVQARPPQVMKHGRAHGS
jgi:type IV secretion system protein VirD4